MVRASPEFQRRAAPSQTTNKNRESADWCGSLSVGELQSSALLVIEELDCRGAIGFGDHAESVTPLRIVNQNSSPAIRQNVGASALTSVLIETHEHRAIVHHANAASFIAVAIVDNESSVRTSPLLHFAAHHRIGRWCAQDQTLNALSIFDDDSLCDDDIVTITASPPSEKQQCCGDGPCCHHEPKSPF